MLLFTLLKSKVCVYCKIFTEELVPLHKQEEKKLNRKKIYAVLFWSHAKFCYI